LPCIIYGIPSEWNSSCWIADSLGSTFLYNKNTKEGIKNFSRLVNTLLNSLNKMSGPCMLKQLLAKLVTRTLYKFRYFIESRREFIRSNYYEAGNNITPEQL